MGTTKIGFLKKVFHPKRENEESWKRKRITQHSGFLTENGKYTSKAVFTFKWVVENLSFENYI